MATVKACVRMYVVLPMMLKFNNHKLGFKTLSYQFVNVLQPDL